MGTPGIVTTLTSFAYCAPSDSRHIAPPSGGLKYERAALKYLARHPDRGEPSLAEVAQMAALLAERSLIMRGL